MNSALPPMTTGQSGAPVSPEKRFELSEGFVKSVLNLATGALVFSVTFLHDIIGIGGEKGTPVIQARCLIAGAWLSFLISVGASLYYLYFLAVASKFERGFGEKLTTSSVLAAFAFGAGLLLLGLFAWFNLPGSN